MNTRGMRRAPRLSSPVIIAIAVVASGLLAAAIMLLLHLGSTGDNAPEESAHSGDNAPEGGASEASASGSGTQQDRSATPQDQNPPADRESIGGAVPSEAPEPIQPAVTTVAPATAPDHFTEDLVLPGFTETGVDVMEEDATEGRSPEGV